MEGNIPIINQAELLGYLRVCPLIFIINFVLYNEVSKNNSKIQQVEEFTRQQIFAQVVGAREVNQATRELIARINLNDQANDQVNDFQVNDFHIGNNVNEDPEP